MTISDYILNAVLILVVVRHMRGRRLAGAALYLPLAIVAYAAFHYLHAVPTEGNDLWLAIAGGVAGLTLGTLCGLCTRVYPDHDGIPYARATVVAAVLWVAGVGARIAFSVYAQHGGGSSIARFSAEHAITTGQAWVAALVLMALAEAVSRTAVLVARAYGPWASSTA
jgi:GNAT superfamily N-acetyltransferase